MNPTAIDAFTSGQNGWDVSMNVREVTAEYAEASDVWEYVFSPDRSAYPDSGFANGYEYHYIGIPFENAVTAPSIDTGSYVGTGLYGSSNPNSLTFDFEPKMLFIFRKYPDASDSNIMKFGTEEKYWLLDSGVFFPESSTLSYNAMVTESGKNFRWYSDRNEIAQMNAVGYVYYYVAIG